jgi:addiction module HigA family antidote
MRWAAQKKSKAHT